MLTETTESIFRSAVARAISEFVSDDSLKTTENFICWLDREVNEAERKERRSGNLSNAEALDQLSKKFKMLLRIADSSSDSTS